MSPLIRRSGLACLVAFASTASLLDAAPPECTHLFPAGGQRGTRLTVTASGKLRDWPPKVWVSNEGIKVTPEKDRGKLAVEIAPDAQPGMAFLRLFNDEGATDLKPFHVGLLPEIEEKERNNDPEDAQRIEPVAVTINGVLSRSRDVDGFAVQLSKGQTLVASMTANRGLGSPMDAVLQIASASGFVLAQNDDDHGLDPCIAFTAPADETYVVRTFAFPAEPNSSIRFAGGSEYVYRLILTTGPFVDYAYPLAVERAREASVELVGWNIPPSANQFPLTASAKGKLFAFCAPVLNNETVVRIQDCSSMVEAEPNDAGSPQAIVLPMSVTGRIDPPRDRDVFRFSAKKGQSLTFRVASRELGFPLDPVLRITDAAGKQLEESDDSGRDSRDSELNYTIGSDGEYCVEVRDLHQGGGPRYVYQLTAVSEPDFELTLATDHFTAEVGKPIEIPVNVVRRSGFNEDIEYTVEGAEATVTAKSQGKSSSRRRGRRRRGNRGSTLELTAARSPFAGPIRIIGATKGTSKLTRTATLVVAGQETTVDQIWLTVTAPKPEPAKKKSE